MDSFKSDRRTKGIEPESKFTETYQELNAPPGSHSVQLEDKYVQGVECHYYSYPDPKQTGAVLGMKNRPADSTDYVITHVGAAHVQYQGQVLVKRKRGDR